MRSNRKRNAAEANSSILNNRILDDMSTVHQKAYEVLSLVSWSLVIENTHVPVAMLLVIGIDDLVELLETWEIIF